MRLPRLVKQIGGCFRQFTKFIGPGFMVAVGYLDPGNWATDMEGGSQFGYRLLFIILLSNIIAIFLQNMTIRMGTVTGMDLASASRRYFPKYLNLFLYLLAELAIIATDMAEVIGSAIALNLLFPSLPLPAGVAITAADVFIILLFYSEEPNSGQAETASMRVIRVFETFVMFLVLAVGICLSIILAESDANAIDVLKGYVPTREIFTDPSCLYVAIGIIGATVMPHNLYLHGFIVQSRCRTWRSKRPEVEEVEPGQWVIQCATRQMVDEKSAAATNDNIVRDASVVNMDDSETANGRYYNMDRLRQYLRKALRENLVYGFIDLVIALIFAFYVNCAILAVASANFYYGPEGQNQVVDDLFGAHHLLSVYLGPAAGVIFALALLCAGQSSTITATLAGQVVMAGFLGMTTRPWVRRIVTRLVAIAPALVAACIAGRSGLNQLLVASQVALSIQLPFAVVPLVYFTSRKHIMKLDLVHDVQGEKKADANRVTLSWIDRLFPRIPSHHLSFLPRALRSNALKDDKNETASTIRTFTPIPLKEWPKPLQYENGIISGIVAGLISLLLIGLNGYLVVSLFMGNT